MAARRMAPARIDSILREGYPAGPVACWRMIARVTGLEHPRACGSSSSTPPIRPCACGVGDYTRGLAVALVGAGHDVTVVTGATSTPSADGPPRVLPLLRTWGIGAFLRAWPRFARPRPDHRRLGLPRGRLRQLLAALVSGSRAWRRRRSGRRRAIFIVHEFIRTGETERHQLQARAACSGPDRGGDRGRA